MFGEQTSEQAVGGELISDDTESRPEISFPSEGPSNIHFIPENSVHQFDLSADRYDLQSNVQTNSAINTIVNNFPSSQSSNDRSVSSTTRQLFGTQDEDLGSSIGQLKAPPEHGSAIGQLKDPPEQGSAIGQLKDPPEQFSDLKLPATDSPAPPAMA